MIVPSLQHLRRDDGRGAVSLVLAVIFSFVLIAATALAATMVPSPAAGVGVGGDWIVRSQGATAGASGILTRGSEFDAAHERAALGDPLAKPAYTYDGSGVAHAGASVSISPKDPFSQVAGGGSGAGPPSAWVRGAVTTPPLLTYTPSGSDDLVNLASPDRTRHILDGEVRPNGSYGGGHRPGTGFPKKSEFPADWSDGRIMHEISDVATDPTIPWRPGDGPTDFWANGTRGGVDIEVLIRNGEIWTGYPTNLPRNPS